MVTGEGVGPVAGLGGGGGGRLHNLSGARIHLVLGDKTAIVFLLL